MPQSNSLNRRLAEKLLILNDRGIGMLTRMYNVSKTCSDPSGTPKVLLDAKYESSIKAVVKKFPGNVQVIEAISNDSKAIIQSLSLYYDLFVDTMDFRDHVYELLTNMDMWQVYLDIKLNFELTKNYLDLIVTITSLMIMMSQVKNRKAILGLYNAACIAEYNEVERNFPRLGNMIMEYDRPLKKLATDFVPHSQLVFNAAKSIATLYNTRNVSAEQWRGQLKLTVISNPREMVKPVQTPQMSCEYLSLQALERWIIFTLALCHPVLQEDDELKQTWLSALRSSCNVPLFRDETIHVHTYLKAFFTSIKGHAYYVNEIKHCCNQALLEAQPVHYKRREFLKNATQEMVLVLRDEPGLLGPKALTVFTVLSYARDEVLWFLRHNTSSHQQKKSKTIQESSGDLHLPELLFHMEEMRRLIRRYSQVLHRYFTRYLCDYDAPFFKELLRTIIVYPGNEESILTSLYNTISSSTITQNDLDAFRLDWFRLQCFMSFADANLHIAQHKELTQCLDLLQFHTQMVDYLDIITNVTSDLSLFCFYPGEFEGQFKHCLGIPARSRYAIVFPLICAHFRNCVHELCPEERPQLRNRCLSLADTFLQQLTTITTNTIMLVYHEHCSLNSKLLPKTGAPLFAYNSRRSKAQKSNRNEASYLGEKPGQESYRKFRENLTNMDKFHMTLTELCTSVNYFNTVEVWGYTFSPKSYLCLHLEEEFAQVLVDLVQYSEDTKHISRPSELLANIQTYMDTIKIVENYIDLDISNIFKKSLQQQTVPCKTNLTIAKLYSYWYSEVFLYEVCTHNMCYSKNCMTYLNPETRGVEVLPFNPEEYSDVNELRALAQLIGACGVLEIKEALMRNVTCHIEELLKLTLANKDVLGVLRYGGQKPNAIKGLVKKLKHAGDFLERMKIVGVLLRFKESLESALAEVLEDRMPFLLNTAVQFRRSLRKESSGVFDETASAMGFPCRTDPILLKLLQEEKIECNHSTSVLMLVFVAVSILELASIGNHQKNVNCISIAIDRVLGALFSFSNSENVEKDMNELLYVASRCFSYLGQEDDGGKKSRETVFLLLDEIIRESHFLRNDLFQRLFPYALIRQAYTVVSKCKEINN